jgi:hypothetical protein
MRYLSLKTSRNILIRFSLEQAVLIDLSDEKTFKEILINCQILIRNLGFKILKSSFGIKKNEKN